MKTLKYILVAIIVISLPMVISEATAGGGKKKSDPMQFIRGAKAWAATCGRCHNIKPPKELTDEEWEVSATHMRVRANLPGNMVRDIIVFLQASNNERVKK